MKRRPCLLGAAFAVLLAMPVEPARANTNDDQLSQSALGASIGPRAIAGVPSSARHCVSGNAANVHPIGWLATGSRLWVTFDADGSFAPVTAMSIMGLKEDRAAVGFGKPDFGLSTAFGGTVILLVGGNNQPGCYRYKVEVEPPLASTAPAVSRSAKAFKPGYHPRAIAGVPSSAKHCIAGNDVANVHSIGRVEQGTTVKVTFDSDFDPIAGISLIDPQSQAGLYVVDDDSGGDLEPEMNISMPRAGTVALFVSGYDGAAGCYSYQVEIKPAL